VFVYILGLHSRALIASHHTDQYLGLPTWIIAHSTPGSNIGFDCSTKLLQDANKKLLPTCNLFLMPVFGDDISTNVPQHMHIRLLPPHITQLIN
jgi:hypothetical protein